MRDAEEAVKSRIDIVPPDRMREMSEGVFTYHSVDEFKKHYKLECVELETKDVHILIPAEAIFLLVELIERGRKKGAMDGPLDRNPKGAICQP